MRRACTSGGVSLFHPYSISRRTAGIVPIPEKSTAVGDGKVSIPPDHVPSWACCTANVIAGRYVKGSETIFSASPGARRATSVSARYLIGGAA
jgi:hypothetical protein